jgi:aminoglycoside phosphotransferase (APT) family kinase protein
VSLGEVGDEPATLGYRPRRRAVLGVGQHVLKLYARNDDYAAATASLVATASLWGIRTAAFEGCLPGKLLTVQPLLSGSLPALPADVASQAGELLRDLAGLDAAQEVDLVVAGPPQHLAVAEVSARFVAAILPALGGRLEGLLRELEATMPSIDGLVLSHGDFHAGQLLVSPDGLAVVDLDALGLAPAALDPATYAARLVFGGPDDLDDASEVLEELLQGYGGRPPGLSWYLATSILRHSRAPFRYLDEHWPERVERMVAAAETALDR